MAISTVKAMLNGQTYNLTYDSASQSYKATITAPNTSSWSLPNHVYNMSVEATDTAGNVNTIDTSDETYGDALKLRVKEINVPTVSIINPTQGAYITTGTPEIKVNCLDVGSGIDITKFVLTIDGVAISAGLVTFSEISGGMAATYVPSTALTSAVHTITAKVEDYDGNVSSTQTSTFTVMTTAPVLVVLSPAEGLNTNSSTLTVNGTSNAAVSGTEVEVEVFLNDVSQGEATVESNGAFTKDITLSTEGANVVKIVATDLAGLSSEVTRNIVYDTTAPTFTSVTVAPNPVDAGQTFVITVKVED